MAAGRHHPPEARALTPPSFEDLATQYLRGLGYAVAKGADGRSFGDFLGTVRKTRAVAPGDRDGARRRLDEVYGSGWSSSPAVAKGAMNESAGTAGGYLVPQDYATRLLEVISEESFLYRRAHRVPLTTAEGLFPKIDVETAPAAGGTSPFFGGLLFKWGSEQAAQETEPKYRQLSLRAWDLIGYAVASNDWLGDTGPAGEEALVRLFGKAAAWYAEYAFFNGTGTAGQMPLGLINAPGTVTVTRNTASQIKQVDVAAMAAKLLPFSWKGAIWATSPSTLAQVVNISSYFLNLEAHEEANCGSLLTRPVYVTDKLASLGTAGDLLLFDPWLYVVGVRQEVLVDVSEHVSFQNNQTNFRVWLRMDGKPQVSGPITLADGTTQVSPYVMLK